MAIQMRQGNEVDFDAEKMLPGEWAVSTDAKIVRICFAPGIVARMATYEAFEADMVKIEAILKNVQDIQTAVKLVHAEINGKSELVAENASLAEEYMLKSKEYAEQAGAFTGVQIAKRDLLGVVKGGDMAVEDDGALRNFKRGAGNTFAVSDTVEAPFSAYKLYGKSVQETVPGNQLLDLRNGKGGTSNGITVEVNDDGSCSYVGTASKIAINIWILGSFNNTSALFTLPAGDYYLSGVLLYSYDGTSRPEFEGAFTLTKETPITGVRAKAAVVGTTYNETIYPMLNKGSTPLPWEPYVGGIPSPNPEYPQPIVSVGEKLASGKNLLDLSSLIPGTGYNVTFTVKDGYVMADGTAAGYAAKFVTLNLEPGTYSLNGLKSADSPLTYAVVIEKDGQSTNYYDAFTVDGTETSIRARFQVNIGDTASNAIVYPMLNSGSTALPWEPYTGGKKAAYDVGIGNAVCGKNLLDAQIGKNQSRNGITFTVNGDGSVTLNGTSTSDTDFYVTNNKENKYVGKSAILSGGLSAYIKVVSYQNYADSSVKYFYDNGAGCQMTFDGDSFGAFIRVYSGQTLSNVTVYPMLRLATVEDDTYSPYTGQSHTLNRTLRAIPVTDTTLANYTDESGQMWVADTIEEVDGKMCLVERVGENTVNNVSANSIVSTSDSLKWSFGTIVSDSSLNGMRSRAHLYVMCDKFTLVAQPDEGSESTGTCVSAFGHVDSLELRFRLLQSEYPTKEDAANAIEGTTVHYPLATPIITELTAEEVSAIESLHSYDGVTTVMSDAWAEVECATSNVAAYVLNNWKAISDVISDLGTADISAIGDGTVKGAIDELNNTTIVSVRSGAEITDVTQIVRGGMWYGTGNTVGAPNNNGWCTYISSMLGWTVNIVAFEGEKLYVSSNITEDGVNWTNSGWTELLTTAGGTLTNVLNMDRSNGERGFGTIHKNNQDGKNFGVKIEDTDKDGNMAVLHICAANSFAQKIRFDNYPNGETGVAYTIFGEHNKPSGSYTGNGSATNRQINTGGIGSLLVLLNHSTGGLALVTQNGSIYGAPGMTSSNFIGYDKCRFIDGVLSISSSDDVFNGSGQSYEYRVI